MRYESIGLGPAPAEEDCASTLDPDFAQANRAECLAYIQAIKRVCGNPPPGARLRISENNREYGIYREVEVVYDSDNQTSAEYARKCDEDAPTTWAEASMEPPSRGRRR